MRKKEYDADANSKGCFDLAISSLRGRLEKSRVVIGCRRIEEAYKQPDMFVSPLSKKERLAAERAAQPSIMDYIEQTGIA